MQKSFSFKAAISFITLLSLLSISIPAFAKPLPLSAFPNALYVVTSKDTPAPQTVAAGKVGVDVFHFDLYSRPHEGAKITKMDFQITGILNSSMLNDFMLYDLTLQQPVGKNAAAQNGHVIFANLDVTLTKNQPKKFALYTDVASYATPGTTFGFLIDSINGYGIASANDLKLNKVKNWASNLFTVTSDATNCVTLSPDASFVGNQTVNPGKDVVVFKFVLKNNCQSDVTLNSFGFTISSSGKSLKSLFNSFIVRDSFTKKQLTPLLDVPFDAPWMAIGFNLKENFLISKGSVVILEAVVSELFSKSSDGTSNFGTIFSFAAKGPDPSIKLVNLTTAEQFSAIGVAQGPMLTVGN